MGWIEDDQGRSRWIGDEPAAVALAELPELELDEYEPDAESMPALIDLSLGELRARPGNAIRELASGAVVRLRDDRQAPGHRLLGYLSFSAEPPPRLKPHQHLIGPCPGDETP